MPPIVALGLGAAVGVGGGVAAGLGGTTLAAAGLAGAGIGSSLGGSIQQASAQRAAGRAAEQQGNFRAQVLRNNARIQQGLAEDVLKRGKVLVNRRQLVSAQRIASQRAALAASGVILDEGSALSITSDAAAVGALEASDVRLSAERQAYSLFVQGVNLQSDASLAQIAGQQARFAGESRAQTTLLSGLGSAAFNAGLFALSVQTKDSKGP